MTAPKTPQDHLSAAPDTVDIQTSAGVITVVHPTKIPSGIIRKGRKLEDIDALFFFVEELNDEKTLEVLDQLNMLELTEFYKEWMQGASLGESSSSES